MNYLLKCRVYNKQYVGETTDAFRLSWNNYKDDDIKFQRNEIACNNIFISIFIAKVAADSWGMFLLVLSIKLMVFNLKKWEITG